MDPKKVSDLPTVSVIVPAYNAESHIDKTLSSLVSQTYPCLEIIVVNDGSEDKTIQRIEEKARQYPQIRVIHQPNRGVAAARNRGIEASQGQYIALVDADDIWFPDAVEELVNRLHQSDARVGVAYGWWVTIDELGLLDGGFRSSTIEGDVLSTLICHNFLGNASSTMIRRDCFRRVGDYDCQFSLVGAHGCEDWDLYLRIAQHYHFCVVPEFLFAYRKTHGSMSSDPERMAQSHRYLLEKLKQRHMRVPPMFYRLSTSSFYLYLAHECNRQKYWHESFHWLGRAIAQGPVFTLIRPVFYVLLVNGLCMRLGKRVMRRYKMSVGQPFQRPPDQNKGGSVIQITDIKNRRLRIWLKNMAQNVLHRILSWRTVS